MNRQPARVLEDGDVRRLLRHVSSQRHPTRNRVIILLSFKAGLRACEISGLTWPMVLTPGHKVSSTIRVSNDIAKKGSGRVIPLHSDLKTALEALMKECGDYRSGPIIRSERGGSMSAASIVNWFGSLYSNLDLKGCSSHSGRRTFITKAARALSKTGGSLRDIQELAGHRALSTTERYIQGDRQVQHQLVSLI